MIMTELKQKKEKNKKNPTKMRPDCLGPWLPWYGLEINFVDKECQRHLG